MAERVVRLGGDDGMGPSRWWYHAINLYRVPFPLNVPAQAASWHPASVRMGALNLSKEQKLLLGAYWNEICDVIGPGATTISAFLPVVEVAHLRPHGLFCSKEIGGVNEDALLECPLPCKRRPQPGTPAWWHMVATMPVRPIVGIQNIHVLVTLTHTACYGAIEAIAGTTVPVSGVVPMYNAYTKLGGSVTIDGRHGTVFYVGPIDGHDQSDWIGVSLDVPAPSSLFLSDGYTDAVPGGGGKFHARNAVCVRPHRCNPVEGLHYDTSDKIALKLFGYGMRGNCGIVCGQEGPRAVDLTLLTATVVLVLMDHPHSYYLNHCVTPHDKAAVVAVILLGKAFIKYGPGTAVADSNGKAVVLAYPGSDPTYVYDYEMIMQILRAESRRKPVMKFYIASGANNCRVFARTVVTRLIERDDSGTEPSEWPPE